MLVAAAALAILITTAIGLHQQAERIKLPVRRSKRGGFGPR